MKKIVLYTVKWASGGIEKVIMNMIRNSSINEYKYELIVSQKISNIYDEELKKYNCEINVINKSTKRIFPIKRIVRDTFGIYKFMKSKQDYILHINLYNFYGLIYAFCLKKLKLKKIVVHAHSSGIDNDRFKIKTFINKIMTRIFDRNEYFHISCSNEASKFCFSPKIKNIYFLPNAIDMKMFYFNEKKRIEIRKEQKWENYKIIGNIGRFVEQKNHAFLIDVFYQLSQRNSDVRLALVGEGDLEKNIRKKIENLKIQDKVFIYKPRTDVFNFYQGFDLFLLPSLYEGLPLVGVEAQASDLECVFSSNVTEQIKILDRATFISLNENKSKWVEIIEKKLEYDIKRKNIEDKLNNSKFNILNFRNCINEIYE